MVLSNFLHKHAKVALDSLVFNNPQLFLQQIRDDNFLFVISMNDFCHHSINPVSNLFFHKLFPTSEHYHIKDEKIVGNSFIPGSFIIDGKIKSMLNVALT